MNETIPENLRRWRQAHFLAYHGMLRRFPWEWKGDLTIRDDLSPEAVNHIFLRWVRDLQTSEHIQVACCRVLCVKGRHPHTHFVMFGRNSDGNITLLDVSPRRWSAKWPFYANIELVENISRASRYIAKHVFKKRCDSYDFDFYNRNLLYQYRN